jgi:pimeloyl-ACP methyl ester carboxylesterase
MRLSFLERSTVGPESGAPILLLHGLVAEAETFRKLGDQLPADRRVVALDLPGMGFSERSRTCDASFGGVAAMVREVIAALGLERPILLGHSYGGVVALRLAASFPGLLRGLILLSPAHPFSRLEDKLVQFYLSPPGRLFAHALPMLPRAVYLAAFRRMPGSRAHLDYRDIEPYLHTLRTPGTIAYVLRLLRSWRSDMAQLAAKLEGCPIELPALLIWGDRDIVVPASTAETLLRHLRASELVTLSGVGHLSNEEAPDECGELIRAWLIGHES